MSSRLRFIALVLVMATIGLAIALISNRVDTLGVQLQESQADRAELHASLIDQKEASTALAEQVKRLGGKPVVDPPATPTQGERGPGPTASQVKAAVADYCTGDRCKPTVSRSQVAAAVADYCAGGLCQAKDGTDGGPGQDGADGTDGADGADGAPGPGPTDEQIAAAVEAYCAGGNCGQDGKDGKDGTNGADGQDGRGIEAVQCDSGLGTFTFTYSDGTTQTVQCTPTGGQ